MSAMANVWCSASPNKTVRVRLLGRVLSAGFVGTVLLAMLASAMAQASVTVLVGDINSDGYVNVGDLQLLVAAWGGQAGPPPSSNWNANADLNNDSYVNVGDLQLLVANWGASNIDTTAPAAVSNLAAGSPTASSLTLTWTAPGDDADTGTAAGYDIRYAASQITETNWAGATQVTGEPTPAAAGTNQSMVVSGLSPDTTYYFAIKTADEVPNTSVISNSASDTTSAPPAPTIVALKRDAGLTAGGEIDPRFDSATVRTVTVSDAGLTNMGSWNWFNYGTATTGGGNTLFEFDLSSIPTGSTINLAQLRLYHTVGNGGLGDGDVSMVLTHDWIEGTQTGGYPGAAGGVSFAHPNGHNTGPWQDASSGTSGPTQSWGPASDSFFNLSVDAGSPIAPLSAPTGTGYHVYNVTSHVQQWVSGTKPNYGWANYKGYWDFHCSEAGTAYQPVLFVGYTSEGGSDTTAPAALSNLATSAPTSTSVILTWTAPGDDGSTGTAASYDIRYSTSQITNDTQFNSAAQCTGEPVPLAAGNSQSFVVNGLSANTTYYFAIRTSDEMPNVSALSNSPSGTTLADSMAPAAVSDLATRNPTSSSLTLTWTAPGGDGSTGAASSYDIRYRTDEAVNDSNWASATQCTGEPVPLAAGIPQNFVVTGLSPSTTYYFALKTSDEVPNTSTLSNSPTGTTQADMPNYKVVLSPRDFKYKGYYIVRYGGDFAGLCYGQGFTHRYVNGQLRFLTLPFFGNIEGGHWNHLVEFAPPASGLGGTVTTRTNHWPNYWGNTGLGSQGCWVGLWYDQANERLWTTWAVDYPDDIMGLWTKSIVVRTLNDDGTVSNVQGPWGLQGVQQRRIYGGFTAVPAWFQSAYGVGPYAAGWGGCASRMSYGVSCGPTFYAIPEPTAYPVGDIPTSAFKTLMDHSAATLSTTWYANGFPTSFDRGVRNSDVENELDSWTSPAPDGLGRWTWEDSNWNTGCWIETPNKQGFITVPKLYSGRTWYQTSTPHCERQSAEIQVFDPNMLGQVALGTRAPWNTYPTYRWQITDTCTPLGLLWGRDGNGGEGGPCGASYDSTTQTLYVYCQWGNNYDSYILIYDVDKEPAAVQDVAVSETAVAGTVSGKAANTETQDDVYEAVTEVSQGNTSQLERKWTFNVTAGSSVIFNIKGYRTSNTEGDDFVFAYSTNGTSWTNMLTVSRTSDDGTYQTYTLPGGTSGTVYVRVQDADRTAGRNNLDTISIDKMFFCSNP